TPTLMRFTSLFGILLFIISDSLLSYNEFINNFKNAKDWIAITYVLSQILLQITPLLWIA
ncbi:MAG: lysoplasmalogenase family protein, partial [Candidatus Kariarchaeum pelagius]